MECRYYQRLEDGKVECQLCPHHCHIADGKTGICRSRRNCGGVLISEVYAKPCALAIDPVEKKPLYHFHSGTTCLSIACTGCNFRCLNCQNYDISQVSPEQVDYYKLNPEEVVTLCKKHHCPGIAYTYTEPLTYIEYIIDCARLAHEAGLWNILVTAGYVCKKPLADLLPYLDAANVDLKSFSDDIYLRVSGGHLQPMASDIVLDVLLLFIQKIAIGRFHAVFHLVFRDRIRRLLGLLLTRENRNQKQQYQIFTIVLHSF